MQKKASLAIFTYDYFPRVGGIGRHLGSLARHINATVDFPFNIKVFSPNSNQLGEHKTCCPLANSIPGQHLMLSILLHFKLSKVLRDNNCTGLILPGGPGGVLLFKKPAVPLIYIANHTYQQQVNALPEERWKKIFIASERRAYQMADKIIAISTTTKESLINDYQIPADNIAVIPPGLSDDYSPNTQISKDPKQLLFVGRLDSRKGFAFLLESVHKLAQQNIHFRLNVVGSGKLAEHFKEQVKTLELEQQVTFLGQLSNQALAEQYQAASIQIIPSKLEGFGIAAIEAMSHSVTVIASRVPGLTDVIQDGENGLLVSYGDSQTLSTALQNLLSDQALRQQLAINAHQTLANYAWPLLLTKYQQLFSNVF